MAYHRCAIKVIELLKPVRAIYGVEADDRYRCVDG